MRFAHPDLSSWLESGATVVTPTAVLASAIQRQHAQEQIQLGRRFWRQPAILSLNAWLQQVWREARFRVGEEVPVLLSVSQEQMLWHEAIERSGARLLSPHASAGAALAAGAFVDTWQLSLEHPAWDSEEDSATFRGWFRYVRNKCRRERWLTTSELAGHAAAWIAGRGEIRHLVFAGFDELPNQLANLVTKLKALGLRVDIAQSRREHGGVLALAAGEFEEELQLAARWARSRIEQQRDASVAIVVRDLASVHRSVEKALREILRPASALIPDRNELDDGESVFHIHAGPPLDSTPVIDSAFALLDLSRPMIPVASISAVLLSPFIRGFAAERSSRALADARLRRLREVELPLATLQKYTSDCVELAGMWPRLRAALAMAPRGRAEAAAWSRGWRTILEALGWPGEQTLTAIETETVRQWQNLLSNFDALGLVCSGFTYDEAAAHLRALASREAPSPGDLSSLVQVLEPADAAALCFDAVWITNASELEWPPVVAAPAYVPLAVQQAGRTPLSTAAGRHAHGARLTQQLRQSAQTLIVSFSNSEGSAPRLSALFEDARQVTPEDLHLWQGRTLLDQLQPLPLEMLEDSQGPALSAAVTLPGGTYVLRSQSACPFQAFARWRLRAEGLDEGAFSFDARDRGEFLHKALAAAWRRIENSDRLRRMEQHELSVLVFDAVEQALASDPVNTAFRVQLRKAEAQRLATVILNWLEYEKRSRPGEFRVRDLEREFTHQLSRLPLRLRADRIDELPDGRLIVIDYKSGKVDRKNLDTERPGEPQLLIYAAMLGTEVDGLYFASLRRDEESASGYGRRAHFGDPSEIPNIPWKAQLESWSSCVESLALQFESGCAAVLPRDGACQYCEINTMCRIREQDRAEGGK